MAYIIKTTLGGLIYIKASYVMNVKKPNSLEGAKVLGQPLVVNADNIAFLSFNVEGHVTYFMTNGFEVSVKILYEEAEEAFNCAKSNMERIIR
ncbi:hypothetical protein FY557_03535 [Chryseobacterium sp. SN22]|uniref:hypothetical protein n=1 Tax=Chryseobacterium sp. SN22 TaxID=2606431 RepID=UPI0011EF1712|nr:hypothetical protein [Chryseobacterium sp. SN22]KAA0129793.1 hypothetical protein FY557_03535 [Chryseobacterium sp. SN22]